MLSPEVWNFPPPKVMVTHKGNQELAHVNKIVNMNNYYKSLIITCPDEIQTPSIIQEMITTDTDYYKLSKCSLTEFVEPVFIESFVKTGRVYCLSVGRNCIVQNCFAITPEGHLIINTIDYIFQTLGLEGTKRPHNFYEVKIDLKAIKKYDKVQSALNKLELFDCFITWEPSNEDICPSSIAKYFSERHITVTVDALKIETISPSLTEIPSIKDVDIDEMVEWIGVLAHDADPSPTETYISTYSQPDSEHAIKSGRLSILIVRGFINPSLITNLCKKLTEYVMVRETDNYWASISIQSNENSLWQWNTSSPTMFQAHDSTCNVFFTHSGNIVYSIGQLNYS